MDTDPEEVVVEEVEEDSITGREDTEVRESLSNEHELV